MGTGEPGQRDGSGDRPAGRGARGSGFGDGQRGAASRGGVRACTLLSLETRGCWSSGGSFKDPFLPNYPLFRLAIFKDSFPGEEWRERRGKKGKREGVVIRRHYNSQVCSVAEISGNFYGIVVVLSGMQPLI